MNKYQESYQRLTNRVYKYDHIEDVYKDLEVLGELVEKATPKNAIKDKSQNIRYTTLYACPNCHKILIRAVADYCHYCGHRLTSSEEEEENCDEGRMKGAKMNRYQEAWDFVKYRFYDGDETQETDGYTDYKNENFMLMQELVDKATPKKPIDESLTDKLCPICGAYLNFDALNDRVEHAPKYCSECGQKIDWSEVEENERSEQ